MATLVGRLNVPSCLIDQLEYNQSAQFSIAASDNHCFLLARTAYAGTIPHPPARRRQWPNIRDCHINTVCVDGGIKNISKKERSLSDIGLPLLLALFAPILEFPIISSVVHSQCYILISALADPCTGYYVTWMWCHWPRNPFLRGQWRHIRVTEYPFAGTHAEPPCWKEAAGDIPDTAECRLGQQQMWVVIWLHLLNFLNKCKPSCAMKCMSAFCFWAIYWVRSGGLKRVESVSELLPSEER